MLTVTLPLLGQAGWHSRWVSPPRLPLNTDPFLEVCSLLPLQLVPRQVPFTRQPLHGQYDCSYCSRWVLWICFICQCSPALGLLCYVMELCRHTWDCWAPTCEAVPVCGEGPPWGYLFCCKNWHMACSRSECLWEVARLLWLGDV